MIQIAESTSLFVNGIVNNLKINMKKIISILAIATILVACGSKKAEAPVVSVDSVKADSVPAQIDSSTFKKK
jgi:PBP1b-binding outer membrane lipoprotein LpoB